MLQEFILHRVIDPAHVSSYAEEVHGEKGAVKEDIRQREVDLAQGLIHHAAEELREPVGKCSEHAENDSSHDVMEVRHDEVVVVEENVHRRRGHVNTAQTAQHEVGDKN